MFRKSSILFMIFLSACASAPAPAVTATPPPPTKNAIPTATPTITLTPLPTRTSTPDVVLLTFTKNAFCRGGPGTQYFDIGSFNQGDTAQADGRNGTDPRWWRMLKPGGEHCWVSDSTVEPNPAAEALPVAEPEKSLPQTPPDLWGDRICKKGGFAITLNWTASSTAEGYYIYLNGEMIQEIKRERQTSYVIKPPLDQPISYGLEAYNSIGIGERITLEDPGCP